VFLRKKLIILSVGLGMIITLATYFYQVNGFAVENVYTNHGFPFAWLEEGWRGFASAYYLDILWGGLLFDVISWSIIAFVVNVITKIMVSSSQKRSKAR
jgi:hypothetical protein